MRLFYCLLLAGLVGLSGCGSTEVYDSADTMTVAELYEEAKFKLDNAEYESAIQLYEKLESRFPYGPYAERAQLEVIYAHYKHNEPDSAILAAERFIKLHPNHPNVDYAYYLRGLASFKIDPSILDRWFNQDMTERDPKSARQAFQYFSELVKRYPESHYTPDAIKRMYTLRNGLAKYESHVARYYLSRGAFVAAANRAKYVVENYQGTPALPEALSLMVQAYEKLGLEQLARDTLKVLELNHAQHPATQKAKQLLQPRS